MLLLDTEIDLFFNIFTPCFKRTFLNKLNRRQTCYRLLSYDKEKT